MNRPRLNGWIRLGIVLSMMWMVGASIYFTIDYFDLKRGPSYQDVNADIDTVPNWSRDHDVRIERSGKITVYNRRASATGGTKPRRLSDIQAEAVEQGNPRAKPVGKYDFGDLAKPVEPDPWVVVSQASQTTLTTCRFSAAEIDCTFNPARFALFVLMPVLAAWISISLLVLAVNWIRAGFSRQRHP